jgi:hypothetical protein
MVGLKLNSMSILIPTNITFGLKDLDLMLTWHIKNVGVYTPSYKNHHHHNNFHMTHINLFLG